MWTLVGSVFPFPYHNHSKYILEMVYSDIYWTNVKIKMYEV